MSRQHSVVVLPSEGASRDAELSVDDLTLEFHQQPQQIQAIAGPSSGDSGRRRSWTTVVYADPALATPAGLRFSAEALSRIASDLASMGPVEVVVADPFTETTLEPTQEIEEIELALEELEFLSDGAGVIQAIRYELTALLAEDSPSEEAVRQLLAEEIERLQTSHYELLGWLAIHRVEAPATLILIRDGFDLSANLQLSSRPELAASLEEVVARHREAQEELSALVAAAGWTVIALAPAQGETEFLPDRLDALQALTTASGGELLTDTDRLGDLVARIKQARVLEVVLQGAPDGMPRPLKLVDHNSGSTLPSPRWASLATPITFSAIRAQRSLEEPELVAGHRSLQSILRPDPARGPYHDGMAAIVEGLLPLDGLSDSPPLFRVTVLLNRIDNPPVVTHDFVDPGPLSGYEAWLFRLPVFLSDDINAASVVVEELHSGRWTGSIVQLEDRALSTEGRRVAEWNSPRFEALTAGSPAAAGSDVAIRVLPPRRRPAKGRIRFETLVSSPAVRRVDFYLDGEKMASDDKQPFAANLELGDDVQTREVSVVAYTIDDVELGRHEITLNPRDDSFSVRISSVASPTGGFLQVSADVRVPGESELDRVEFFWNEALVETLQNGPFVLEIPDPGTAGQDFVRVVAYLADGTWIDDAQLLGASGVSERVEVNLVELHVMVSGRNGDPVEDLEIGDFAVKSSGERQQIERIAKAEEVPLLLGLVVDTSESMMALMNDAKKAGAQFLANTLVDGDSAFLVDFDTQPRLAHDTTDNVIDVLNTFARLSPDGFTALYDAVIFSMLQFEEAAGRKALVLLTDGDDYRSRYGPRRCIQYGRRLGVPVYIISLAGIYNPRRNLRKIDLEGITEGTGGQVFYISELPQLTEAYDRINKDLRSQYILTFSTDRALTEEELAKIEVDVEGQGMSVRTVVGGQQVQ